MNLRAGEWPASLVWLLAAVAAGCTAVSVHPLNLWWVAVLGPVVVTLASLGARNTRSLFLALFLTQLALFLWIHSWTRNVSEAGYPALSAYSACWVPISSWLIRRASRHPRFSQLPCAVLLPVIWVGVEFFRGRVFFEGYPWYFTVHPLVEAPILVQSADLFGTYGVSLLILAVSGILVDAISIRLRWHSGRSFRWCTLVVAALFAANGAYGWWRMSQPLEAAGPRCLAIQTNQLSQNKIGRSFEQQVSDTRAFLVQTYDAFEREGPVDLIIWPETTLPGFGLEPAELQSLSDANDPRSDIYLDAMVELRRATKADLLIGSPVSLGLQLEDGRWIAKEQFNSAYLIDTDAPPFQRYDKIALTPFGEVMPYISSWDWLEEKLLAIGASGMSFNLDVGRSVEPLILHRGGQSTRIAAPICFEDTVPWLCRRIAWDGARRRADLFINISNDGWLGASNRARLDHAQMARFRAIENRTPMIRCVNTGVSISIDSCGRIVSAIGAPGYGQARVDGDLIATPQLDSRVPLFATLGDAAGWLVMFAASAVFFATFFARPLVTPAPRMKP